MNKNIVAALAALAAAAVIVAISWLDARSVIRTAGSGCSEALSAVKGFRVSDGNKAPVAVPVFIGADGTETHLSDFAGQGVVVNFWATWCAPCVEEMPSLLRLKNSAPAGIDVLAVSEDREGAEVAGRFLDKNGWSDLGVAVDRKGALLRALGVTGLPTTVLITPDGREAARLVGIAHWDSPEVAKILGACIAPKGQER